MTLEEANAKYPVGSKITIIDDLEKIKEDTADIGWEWFPAKKVIVGKELRVVGHYREKDFIRIDVNRVEIPGAYWSIHPDWIVRDEPKDDPDELLKKQRDDILASIFGG